MMTVSDSMDVFGMNTGLNQSTSVTFIEILTRILSSGFGVKELPDVMVVKEPQLGVVDVPV
jgi:hypothetical protein